MHHDVTQKLHTCAVKQHANPTCVGSRSPCCSSCQWARAKLRSPSSAPDARESSFSVLSSTPSAGAGVGLPSWADCPRRSKLCYRSASAACCCRAAPASFALCALACIHQRAWPRRHCSACLQTSAATTSTSCWRRR